MSKPKKQEYWAQLDSAGEVDQSSITTVEPEENDDSWVGIPLTLAEASAGDSDARLVFHGSTKAREGEKLKWWGVCVGTSKKKARQDEEEEVDDEDENDNEYQDEDTITTRWFDFSSRAEAEKKFETEVKRLKLTRKQVPTWPP
jgi:hypothetical protein